MNRKILYVLIAIVGIVTAFLLSSIWRGDGADTLKVTSGIQVIALLVLVGYVGKAMPKNQ